MNTTCPPVSSTVNYKLSEGWLDFVVLFYISSSLLALAGNFLVLLTIIRRPVLQRVSYYLVAALALEDLLHGVIVGTVRSLANINGFWQLGGATCLLFGYLNTCMSGAELYLLTAITVDRYVACCIPLRYIVLMTQKRCKFIIAGCWLYPAFGAILPLIGFSSYQYAAHLQTCEIELTRQPLALGYVGLVVGTSFVPCTVAIVVCQIKIYKQVKKITDQPLPQVKRSGTSSAIVMVSSRPTKATLNLSLVTGIYFLCWLPYVIVRITKVICIGSEKIDVEILSSLEIAAVCIVTVTKFVNPILYSIYNREFRRECIMLFR